MGPFCAFQKPSGCQAPHYAYDGCDKFTIHMLKEFIIQQERQISDKLKEEVQKTNTGGGQSP